MSIRSSLWIVNVSRNERKQSCAVEAYPKSKENRKNGKELCSQELRLVLCTKERTEGIRSD